MSDLEAKNKKDDIACGAKDIAKKLDFTGAFEVKFLSPMPDPDPSWTIVCPPEENAVGVQCTVYKINDYTYITICK